MPLKFWKAKSPTSFQADDPATGPENPFDGSNAAGGFGDYGSFQPSNSSVKGMPSVLPQSNEGASLGLVSAGPQLIGAVTLGAAMTNSSVGAGGATATQVQQALDESGLSVNGTGIKVGVLSDSFNNLGGAAMDEADGALPPASDIQVLEDLDSGGSDEGRAMMQIVHDIAPGASLAFYTAFNSEQDFANGILALAADGCKVICDDVSYYDEPFFQNGIIAQAIQTVEGEGVVYVTSAGNEASNAYQAAWTPMSGTFDGVALTDAESFGGKLVQTVTIALNSSYDVPLLLEWNQPFGAAASDLELLAFQNGQLVDEATNSDNGEPTNPWTGLDLTAGATYQIAIENLSGPDPGLIKEIAEGDGIPVTIRGANIGTVFGHAMTPGVITAGAVSAADTPAFGIYPPQSESFSSSGAGTELLFDDNGAPLASPDLLSPVVVSGLDDISTTVSGGLSDFYGTSAASASLAGVAALMLSANPNLTPAQIEQILEDTANPMGNSAVSGAGLVQVDAAIAAVQPFGIAVSATASEAVQGGSPVALLGGVATITDSASSTLASATVTIANMSGNAVAGDLLFVNGQQSGTVSGVTVHWNASTGTLTLTGSASIATYQTLLGEISYRDTGVDTSSGSHPQRTVTWTVNDGSQNLSATSQISVDRAPTAGNVTASVLAGATVSATAAAGVISNDGDLDDDALTITGVTDTAHGAGTVGQSLAGAYGHLTLNANGSYSYAADLASAINSAPSGSHPQDLFTYTVSDGNGGTAQATLDVTLDRSPTANNVTSTDAAGATEVINAASGVLANDTDPDGDALSVSAVHGLAGDVGISIIGAYGHLTLNANGSYSYAADLATAINTAPTGSHLQDSFSYTITDGHGGQSSATLSIALNRAPTLGGGPTAATYVTGQSSAHQLASTIAITNPDGQTLSGATVSITGGTFAGDGDLLAAITTGTSITASYNAATETLALTGLDTLADYQQVLDSVSYSSSAKDPTNSSLDPSRTIAWVLNNGDSSNNLSQPQITTVNFVNAPKLQTSDNFNSTGTSDILFQDSSNGDAGFYQISNGASLGWYDVGSPSAGYSVVGAGDFYGNGSADVLFRNPSTGDTMFDQIANGVSAGWDDIGKSSTAYSVVGTGDFYGNGSDEILFRNNATGDTGFDQISSNGSAHWVDIGGSSTAYSVVGVGDFTGNGTDDILFRNNATGDVGFYGISNGALTGWHDIGSSSTAYSVVGVGDFYGNGTDDILFRNNSTGDTGLYAINNGANTGWHDVGASSTAYSVVATGNYNGGGTSDILFRNNSTGDTGFYQIANGANAGWHDIGSSSTAYHVVG